MASLLDLTRNLFNQGSQTVQRTVNPILQRIGANFSGQNVRQMGSNIKQGMPEVINRASQFTPFTATRFMGQSVPQTVQQFRAPALRNASFGLINQKVPQPKGVGQNIANLAGNIVGSVPAFTATTALTVGKMSNLARMKPIQQIGVGLLAENPIIAALTTSGGLKERTKAGLEQLKPANLALGAPLALAGIRATQRKTIQNVIKNPDAAENALNIAVKQLTSRLRVNGKQGATAFIEENTAFDKYLKKAAPDLLADAELNKLRTSDPKQYWNTMRTFLSERLSQANNPDIDMGLSIKKLTKAQHDANLKLGAQSTLSDINKNFFDYQNKNMEFVNKAGFTEPNLNAQYHQKIEDAGDIGRELSLGGDINYIGEKVNRLKKLFTDPDEMRYFTQDLDSNGNPINQARQAEIVKEYVDKYNSFPGELSPIQQKSKELSMAVINKDIPKIKTLLSDFSEMLNGNRNILDTNKTGSYKAASVVKPIDLTNPSDKAFMDLISPDSQLPSPQSNPILEKIKPITSKTPVRVPKERGFVTSVQEALKVTGKVKAGVSSTYTPKPNTQLMGEAQALLQEGASIDFKNAKGLDKKVAATIQEALNLQNQGNHQAAANLYNNLSEAGTEAGRTVQAFSLLDNMSPEAIALSAAGKIRKYNQTATKKIPELTGQQVKMIADKVQAIDLLKGRERNIALNELNQTINSFIPTSISDKIISVWKAGLLTSFRTHERNFVGNSVHGVAEIAKDIPATAADILMSGKTGTRTTTFTTRGAGEFASKSTAQQVDDIVSKGYDPGESLTKFDHKQINWGEGS